MNFEVERRTITEKDAILYALGLGCASDGPLGKDLDFVYEKRLRPLPTILATFGRGGAWTRNPALGLHWQHILHAGQSLQIHEPVPLCTPLICETSVEDIVDKGADRGCFISFRKAVMTEQGRKAIATAGVTIFLPKDGGFGGKSSPSPPRLEMPQRKPDHQIETVTGANQALIYRLSGDLNPLHVDPEVARLSGVDTPILHGLCTYGIAGTAIVRSLCDYQPTRLRLIDVRFTAPVFPGETIVTEIWQTEDGHIRFRCIAKERQKVVIDDGAAIIA